MTEFEDEEEEQVDLLEEEAEEEFKRLQDQPIKLARSLVVLNVGKSTLIQLHFGMNAVVYDMPGTTRDSIYIPMQRDERIRSD